MAQHAQLRVDTGLAIYFCDPPAHGNEEPMRTPTACYGNTFRKALI